VADHRQRYHVEAHSDPARWDDCQRCIAMYAATDARCPSCPSALTVRGSAAICENNHRWIRDAERPDWREAIWDETLPNGGGWALGPKMVQHTWPTAAMGEPWGDPCPHMQPTDRPCRDLHPPLASPPDGHRPVA
jgi:hypothetical protein